MFILLFALKTENLFNTIFHSKGILIEQQRSYLKVYSFGQFSFHIKDFPSSLGLAFLLQSHSSCVKASATLSPSLFILFSLSLSHSLSLTLVLSPLSLFLSLQLTHSLTVRGFKATYKSPWLKDFVFLPSYYFSLFSSLYIFICYFDPSVRNLLLFLLLPLLGVVVVAFFKGKPISLGKVVLLIENGQ